MSTAPNDPNAAYSRPESDAGHIWQPPKPAVWVPPVPIVPAPQQRFTIRPRALAILALAVALLAAVAGGAWLAYNALLGHDDRATAAYAPSDAWAYVAINTDPTSRAWLDAWGIAKRVGIDDDLADLPSRLASDADQDPNLWSDLVKPALGDEVGFVVMPIDGETEPSFAAIVLLRDDAKAPALIERLFEDQQPQPADYRGVAYQISDNGDAAGVVDDALVVADSDAAFKRVVDARQDGALAAEARFTQAAERAAADPLVFAWIDTTATSQAVEDLAAAEPSLALGAGLADGQDVGVVTVTMKADDDALRLTALSEKQPAGQALASAGDATAFASELPASTLFYTASSDFYARVWQPLMAQFDAVMGVSGADESGVSASSTAAIYGAAFGIDVDRDLLAHLTGPFAIAAGAEQLADEPTGDARFISQVDDPAALRATLDTLASALEDQGVPVTRTADGFSADADNYHLAVALTGDTLRITAGNSAASATGALEDDASFKRAMATLPDDAAWTGYVNLARALDLIPAAAWSGVDPDLRTALESLDALAFSTGADGAGTRTELVVLFTN